MSHPLTPTRADVAGAPVAVPVVPLLNVGMWLAFFGLLATLAIFFVGAEQGALSLVAGNGVHEWVHDARHLLGFPCH